MFLLQAFQQVLAVFVGICGVKKAGFGMDEDDGFRLTIAGKKII